MTFSEMLRKQAKVTRRWIKPKHRRYLTIWKRKLGLADHSFILFAYPNKKMKSTAALVYVNVVPGVSVIGISTKSLSSDDWRDSLVHELLHTKVRQYVDRYERRLCDNDEEDLVVTLTPLLAR